jgi:hypothetical protein
LGNLVRYKRLFPTKSTNYQLPFPNDNSFSGFLFDADQHDAALIMLFLAAKLPVLPWLHDTLPNFTGKAAVAAHDIELGHANVVTGKRVEFPVTFDGYLRNGALGIGMNAANGTRILEVRTMTKTDDSWVEAVASEDRVAIAAAGSFHPDDVIATLVVEAADNGDVTFTDVTVGDEVKGMRKQNVFGAVSGETAGVRLSQNSPNPFTVNATTAIGYVTPADGKVLVRVYDVLGREIRTLVNTELQAGSYQVEWDGRDAQGNQVESGTYFYRIDAAGQSMSRAMQVRN